jgi:hypothetical protein
MPEFDSATRTKIDALRALVAAGEGPQVFELCKVSWTSDEADAIYYSVMQTDEIADPAPPSLRSSAAHPRWLSQLVPSGPDGFDDRR